MPEKELLFYRLEPFSRYSLTDSTARMVHPESVFLDTYREQELLEGR